MPALFTDIPLWYSMTHGARKTLHTSWGKPRVVLRKVLASFPSSAASKPVILANLS